ncbi:MAG: hypothetical protein SV062_00100 [Thermodesulfobacteriota bacterium]|nr:hypothetical protein [Thermodesulfobacteriota bacterium]
MKFAFIAHPRNIFELRASLFKFRYSFFSLLPRNRMMSFCLDKKFVENSFNYDLIISERGASCEGKIYLVLLTPEQFINNQQKAVEMIEKACDMANGWGAGIIGLGALAAVVGSRGQEVENYSTIPVTTGNSLTVYSSVKTFDRVVKKLEIDPKKEKVLLIGFPGSIILTLTKILAERGINLRIFSRRKTSYLNKFLTELKYEYPVEIEVVKDLKEGISKGRLIISATSSGNVIDPDFLLPGSVVFDIAQPKDVIKKKKRRDVLILDTGIVTLPLKTPKKYRWSGWMPNDIPACLAETITLAMEDRAESFSLGRELSLSRIGEIGSLSEKHGFILDNFRNFKKPVNNKAIEYIKGFL